MQMTQAYAYATFTRYVDVDTWLKTLKFKMFEDQLLKDLVMVYSTLAI